ncbi:MAG: double-strand break repair protein AddB [Alphaproteobacteria bacterium]|nr:double-strand break repair protein AddB [Alphaproteobacteria bacterium]
MSDTGFFTIPAGQPFALDLARALLAETGGGTALGAAQIWLPSRRAQRAVQAAFTELSGGAALLMPNFCLLGEADADALDILEAGQPGFVPAEALPDAVHPLARQILLARQIEAFVINGQRPGPAQAFKMAEELAGLLDQLQRAGVEAGAEAGQLAGLLPDEMAMHWQSVLAFVRIVSDHWPALLAEQNKIDPVQRQQKLIDRQIALWQANPPTGRVILAGSTGSQPATRRMMRAVAALPAGAVILPGLDLPDERAEGPKDWAADWAAIGADAGHPLHILHDTLAELEMPLEKVRLWPGCEPEAVARRRKRRWLLAEAFRPAEQSAAWRRLAEDRPELDRDALSGLHLLSAAHNYQQAAQIALLMREMLEHSGKRAMLVTPDRALARQVQAELRKWQIEVDDSAGTRLADTMPGRFLQLICEAVASDFAPLALASLAKHPLCAGGLARADFTSQFQQLERAGLRGPLAGTGWQGLQDRLADKPQLAGFARQHILAPLAGLHALMHAKRPEQEGGQMADLAGLAGALGEAAEALAAETGPQSGILRLYAGPAGEAAGRLLAELIDCEASWPLATADFPTLLQSMAEQVTVRSPWETHPNLAILGTVEARLQSADRIILAGLNEGVWPPAFVPDIWMNETARKELGLPDRRWRTALSAHDFMMLAGADEVWITRADRSGESPAQPSRWLARLQAVLTAGGLAAALSDKMPSWMQAALEDRLASSPAPCPPPAPKPALADRPRKFSATDFDKWISDPYAIYAARVLHLKALPELDERPGPALRGSLIHKILGKFLESFPAGPLPADAAEQLQKQAAAIFARWSDNSQVAGLWRLRLAAALDWFLAEEARRRMHIEQVCPETKGQITLALPAGEAVVTARADRLELLQDGTVLLADYKTGGPPRKSQVEGGRATQLLVEAVIAAAGGFSEQQGQPGKISALEYWQIKGQAGDAGRITSVLPADFDSETVQAALTQLIQLYDNPDQPYLSEPDPAVRPKFSDVRHLARVREWRAWEVEDD